MSSFIPILRTFAKDGDEGCDLLEGDESVAFQVYLRPTFTIMKLSGLGLGLPLPFGLISAVGR